MRLKALRLQGFKSFADRTEILFHDGITAVVGPNGCGKSNISDAIRWVLGEQRPTAIRGAKMEEAIFQGTLNRRPVNRGTVSIEVDNKDGTLPVSFQEVEISRTVYRDGGSDYSLNRTACRLRDVQDLCRDTGLGANAYAVIENRMIDAILSERAEERRGLFEEAAGIGKYKDRRKAASRRLERAETDLQRLEDLVGEVQSKVRSLARQKGRAERHRELRKRRLDVDVTLARRRSRKLEERLAEVRERLGGGLERDESLQARIQTAESRLESLRVEQVAAERERMKVAARLGEVKDELVRWERELAVAEEQSAYARRRIAQIEGERADARARIVAGEAESAELKERRAALAKGLEKAREELEQHQRRAGEVRQELSAVRQEVKEVEAVEQEAARRMAQLQGDLEASEASRVELEGRARHLEEELEAVRAALDELNSQGDLFSDEVATRADELALARSRLEEVQASAGEARETFERARKEEMEAQDRAGSLATRRSALARMEEDREGLDPAIQAVLQAPPEGVQGLLADFLEPGPGLSSAVEAYLGVYLRALVVRDCRAASELADWFRDRWEGGGGMIILPLDRVPEVDGPEGVLDRVTVQGAGARWAEALLHGVELAESWEPGPDGAADPRPDRVAADGKWVERGGVLSVGNPLGATDLLERKERLRAVEKEAEDAERAADEARERREKASDRLDALDRELEEARSELRDREDAWRRAQAKEGERSERRGRLERSVRELETRLASSRTGIARARARAEAAGQEREGLLGEEERMRERRAETRKRLDGVQEEWEEVRSRESVLSVEKSRLEGELSRSEERLRDLDRTQGETRSRIEALDREEKELEAELERVGTLREEGGEELERLFGLRDQAESELRAKDQTALEFQDRLGEAERDARSARVAEREASERRHELELEARELEGRLARTRDRLEGEWGRPFDQLVEEAEGVEGGDEELEAELREIVEMLDRLGPVNMLAVEEHEEESARLSFLTEQRNDLVEARDDLGEAIREINQAATRLFMESFEAIRENFRDTFQRLFEGGECDLRLRDPDDPLESSIEIQAAPRGKRTQRIDLLSGGERALTALALLFGIYLVKPSPFCVLDEVDAPLDESNIGRFIRLLQEFKDRSQFIVITHNPRTIEAADWIYGVTMEEPGVSTIVGVRLDEALETVGV